MRIGFAHRVGDISLYSIANFPGSEEYLNRLGKYKMGKGCLYIKRLADVNLDVLKEMIQLGYQENKHLYPSD